MIASAIIAYPGLVNAAKFARYAALHYGEESVSVALEEIAAKDRTERAASLISSASPSSFIKIPDMVDFLC